MAEVTAFFCCRGKNISNLEEKPSAFNVDSKITTNA
jgi:hypothetical protein